MRTSALACGVLLALANGFCASPARIRTLILTGETDLPYHDWRVSTPFLREALENTGRFDVKVLEEVRGADSSTLAPFDVLIVNYNGPRWGERTEHAIEEFVTQGKGLVAFHGISYGAFFGQVQVNGKWQAGPGKGWEAWPALTGATWKPENIGHGARHVFAVKWRNRDHPISAGLEPEFLANDELYHRMDLRADANVLATAFSDPKTGGTGRDEPILWTVPSGKGRAVHLTLGHDLSSMVQPGFVTALARSTEWAATGSVTLPAKIEAHPAVRMDAARVLVVTGGHWYPVEFYTLFDGFTDLTWTHATSPAEAFRPGMQERYDAIVLHDMHEGITEPQQAALRSFVEAGKGVVSIHHSIVDYTSWPWWYEDVIGGKFFTADAPGHAKSAYHEGVRVVANVAKGASGHSVLRGVGPIVLEDDEVYKGMWISPKVTVLMETDHPENDRPVVYTGPDPKIRSVYIQLGHSAETFRHPGYRRLVHNAILWAAGKDANP